MERAGKSMHLGREELCELVWSEPMVKLAGRFATTNVGLAKSCWRTRRTCWGEPLKRRLLP